MPPCAARVFLLLAAACAAAFAEERRVVYLAEGMPEAPIQACLKKLFGGEEKPTEFVRLTATCRTPEEAKLHARAIEAGVSVLPCLVLADEQGAYAAMPLQDPEPGNLARARALAAAPDRHAAHQRRLLCAHIYLLCARAALCRQDDDTGIENAVKDCRAIMENEMCSPEQRQFLGFHCLYPLLMRQYVRGYNGAHTPYTEAKLLEAIAVLEGARDIDRDSATGKKAHAERERLRVARRKSREYE